MVQFQCYVDEVKTLKDKGLRIRLETQELAPAEKAVVFSLDGLMWACFSEIPVRPEDIEIKEVKVDGSKTPSERLRGVLWAFWSEKKPTPTFEEFYLLKMGDITEWIKSKLN